MTDITTPEVRRDDFSFSLINLDKQLMFPSDHGKFSIINPQLINPNNERKPFIIVK